MKTLRELTGIEDNFISIKCPVCARDLILSRCTYFNFKGPIKCSDVSHSHSLYVKIKEGQLSTPPQPIYFDDPDFKSPPIPNEILNDFKEAAICLGNNAPKACVVMCGRILEGVTIDKNAKGNTLYDKIKNLYESGMISKTLYDAFTKVRVIRNVGAHYISSVKIKVGEEKKIFDITKHIIEHVYILPLLIR